MSVGNTLDLSSVGGFNSLAGRHHLQFTTINIAGNLVVPSGTVLRATGNVTISGTITVLPSAEDNGAGEANPGVARAAASVISGGTGLGVLQSSMIRSAPVVAGGAGARNASGSGGEGGGAFAIFAVGNVAVQAGATINANGNNGVSANDVLGVGGGAGGIIVIASKGTITVGGTMRANGGSGSNGTTVAGNGEGGGGGGGGGIIHLIAPSAPSVTGTLQVNGGAAGSNGQGGTFTNAGHGGGACGGDGGDAGGQAVFNGPMLTAQAGSAGWALSTVVPAPENLLVD